MKFRGDIDGLRALAIVLVVLFHADAGLDGGFVGVDVFFVLSGFLITRHLLQEVETKGRIGLAGFWARRARRLLPAATLMMISVIAVSWLFESPLHWVDAGPQIASAACYLANVFFARESVDYFAADINASPVLHLWSLSIEEQFYVAWPVVVLGASGLAQRRSRSVRTVAAGVFAFVIFGSFAIDVWFVKRGSPWGFFGAPMRAWQLGAGALVAASERGIPRASAARAPLAAIGMFSIVLAAVSFERRTAYPGVAALLPTIGTVLVVAAGSVENTISRLLAAAPLQWIGRRSYSIYLWHWPALVFLRALVPIPQATHIFFCVVGSVVLASVSYTFVESPLRKARALVGNDLLSLAGGGLLMAVGVVGGVLLWASGNAHGGDARFVPLVEAKDDVVPVDSACEDVNAALRSPQCRHGDPTSTRTVLLAGDSHARQWLPVLDELGRAHGLSVVLTTQSSCPPYPVRVVSKYRHVRPRCVAWQDDLLRLASAPNRPDAVVFASSGVYIDDMIVDESERPVVDFAEASAAWHGAVTRLFRAWQGVDRYVILDNPRMPFDPLRCLAVGAAGCDVPQEVALHPVRASRDIEQSAARELGVTAYDPVPFLCPDSVCKVADGGIPLYRDNNHLTTKAVLSQKQLVDGWLFPRGPSELAPQ